MFAVQRRHVMYILLSTSLGIFLCFSHRLKRGYDNYYTKLGQPKNKFSPLKDVNRLEADYQTTSESVEASRLSTYMETGHRRTYLVEGNNFSLSKETKSFEKPGDKVFRSKLTPNPEQVFSKMDMNKRKGKTILPSIIIPKSKQKPHSKPILTKTKIKKIVVIKHSKKASKSNQTYPFSPHVEKVNSKKGNTRDTAASKRKQKTTQTKKLSEFRNTTSRTLKNTTSSYCPESPFQSAEEIDFPTVRDGSPRIPRIIHQIFTDEYVPEIYTSHIQSFVKNNPTWQYRFWTYKSGLELLKKSHPYLVKVYSDFGNTVRKADLLRYAVIYKFGGFYFDLDTDNLRPLDRVTMKYACILPAVPFEQSVLVIRKPFHMVNGVIMCRPNHPFFKQVLWNLRNAQTNGRVSDATGPIYITHEFMRYVGISEADFAKTKKDRSSNSPYFYKGKMKEDDKNAVYVPNSQYFMDKINPIFVKENGFITKVCKEISELPPLSKCACVELERRGKVRNSRKYTFTVHHFYFLWGKSKNFIDNLRKIHIRKVVPNCVLYTG